VIAAKNWLPESAIFDGTLDTAFCAKAENVFKKWFMKSVDLTSLCSRSFKQNDRAEPCLSWTSDDGCISVFVSEHSKKLLFSELLQFQIGKKPLTVRDHELVDVLIEKFMQDVCENLAQFFEADVAQFAFDRNVKSSLASPGDWYIFSLIWNNGLPLFHMRVQKDLVINKRKSLSSIEFDTSMDIHSVADALTEQGIKFGAFTGTAELKLSELKDLMPGDVVVLDQDVGAPVTATINGQLCENISCYVEQGNDVYQLKILG